MTIAQFELIADGLKAVYGDKILNSKEAVKMWFELLKDMEYTDVARNAKAHMQMSPYPPTVADLRKMVLQEEMSELEAWALVKEAIGDAYYHSKERFDELPERIQKAVGSPDVLKAWSMQDMSTLPVTESNFIKSFRTVKEREKRMSQLSSDILRLGNQQKMIGEKRYKKL